jgi:gas vesicle protein
MQEDTRSTTKTLGLIFLGGAILGVVAGVLLAPKSGKETRKDIQTLATKVSKEVSQAAHRTKSGLEAAIEKGRTLLTEKAA